MDPRVRRLNTAVASAALVALGCTGAALAGGVLLDVPQVTATAIGLSFAVGVALLACVDGRANSPLTILGLAALGTFGFWFPRLHDRLGAWLAESAVVGLFGETAAARLELPLAVLAAGLGSSMLLALVFGRARLLERAIPLSLGVASVPLIPDFPGWAAAASAGVWQAVLLERIAFVVRERQIACIESTCHQCGFSFPDRRPLYCPRCNARQEDVDGSQADIDGLDAVARSRMVGVGQPEPTAPVPAPAAAPEAGESGEALTGRAAA